jgi:hypothetical protein
MADGETDRFLKIVVDGEIDAVTQAVAEAAARDKLGGGERGSHGVDSSMVLRRLVGSLRGLA